MTLYTCVNMHPLLADGPDMGGDTVWSETDEEGEGSGAETTDDELQATIAMSKLEEEETIEL